MASRFFHRTVQLVLDLAILAFAYALAYVVRFEGAVPPVMLRTLAWTLPYAVALYYGAMMVIRRPTPRLALRGPARRAQNRGRDCGSDHGPSRCPHGNGAGCT
jgi:hypothetical protein